MIFICAVCLSVSAFAAPSDTQTCEIPEISMSLEIPSYLNVISKGIKQNDPLFSAGEFDYIQTMSVIRDNNDYYLVYDKNKTFSIEIKLSDSSLGFDNMSKAGEKKLQSAVESIQKNADVLSASVYESEKYKFIDILETGNEGSNTIFTESFITTYNKQDLSITINSINDKPTATELDLLKGIVNSVAFPEEKSLDLSALTPSLIAAFIVLTAGFVAVAVIRLKNIPIPLLELESNVKAKKPSSPAQKSSAAGNTSSSDPAEPNKPSDGGKRSEHAAESPEKESPETNKPAAEETKEEQPESFSDEELAAAIANFTD